jgi:BirA family transcriptional regulator, biotin operon repressor / biotin---[acetyl-CoA-carboxylase] ligase
VTPETISPQILRFDSLDSTNVKARELARQGAAGEGTVLVATRQTAGKGRGNHLWHSPEGGLFLSALLYPKQAKRLTDLPILVGVALAQAVRQIAPKSCEVTLKWPNDVLINWKKVGGILCEALGEECFELCVAGIGLNVNVGPNELAPFQKNPFGATSFQNESEGGAYDLDQVLSVLLAKLFTLYRLYQEEGMEPIRYLWEHNCAFVGKKVELSESGVREPAPKSSSGKSEPGVTVGTVLGIDESGGLVLSNAKGERRSYYTGAITCYWP